MPAAGEIHRLKKRRFPAGFLAGDESVKHNRHFNPSLSHLNLIFSRQPNFLATTLITGTFSSLWSESLFMYSYFLVLCTMYSRLENECCDNYTV